MPEGGDMPSSESLRLAARTKRSAEEKKKKRGTAEGGLCPIAPSFPSSSFAQPYTKTRIGKGGRSGKTNG